MNKLACLSLLLAASGCPSIDTDTGEDVREPVVEFDPSNSIVPFPNNLLINPMTGKVTLPMQCGESPAATFLRTEVLNKLDGFGAFEAALTVTFSEEIKPETLADRIVLYKRVTGTTPVDPATATPIPTVTRVGATVRFDKNCMNPRMVPQVAIIPRVPLEQKSFYTAALLDGIETASGARFKASGTWQLVRGKQNPVTINEEGRIVADQTPLDPSDPQDAETLRGINLLWNAHAGAVKFLADDLPADKRQDRSKILLAWEFKTQTTTDPLDVAVTGSPASKVDAAAGLEDAASLPDFNRNAPPFNTCDIVDSDVQCYLKIVLGNGIYGNGNAACAAVGCAAIGDVVGATLKSQQYQAEELNPYTGPGARKIPGAWGDPVNPDATFVEDIDVRYILPITQPPAAGWPTVIFQHGLGRTKMDAIAIAGQLAGLGFATVAIDAVAHDSRAVRISTAAERGCANVPGSQRPDEGPPTTIAPQCYAPFLSTNLAATRDGIRQTALDHQQLVAALKQCGAAGCGDLKVDPTRIMYLGMSLGGIIGGITAATSADIKGAVLNVPGVGWADILENTESLAIRCMLVDGLIDAGILMGDKSSGGSPPTAGLCLGQEWKAQPGYQQFAAIGRWILDPADPANYTRKLAPRRFLIQEVDGDAVVPNIATANMGALVGLTSADASPCDVMCGNTGTPPSAAIGTNPQSTKWVRYKMVEPDAPAMFPGNVFEHGSLLSSTMPLVPAYRLGTARMRIDALTYLVLNR